MMGGYPAPDPTAARPVSRTVMPGAPGMMPPPAGAAPAGAPPSMAAPPPAGPSAGTPMPGGGPDLNGLQDMLQRAPTRSMAAPVSGGAPGIAPPPSGVLGGGGGLENYVRQLQGPVQGLQQLQGPMEGREQLRPAPAGGMAGLHARPVARAGGMGRQMSRGFRR